MDRGWVETVVADVANFVLIFTTSFLGNVAVYGYDRILDQGFSRALFASLIPALLVALNWVKVRRRIPPQ